MNGASAQNKNSEGGEGLKPRFLYHLVVDCFEAKFKTGGKLKTPQQTYEQDVIEMCFGKPRTLQIEIDHLPYRELSPNARVHWAEKSKAVKISREEIGWLAKAKWHGQPAMMRVVISYQFTVKVSRSRDEDNLVAACKPWQDGLIDAGVIFYDDARHLKLGTVGIIPGESNKTVITVEEAK
jgi:hypothetical protein